MKIINDPLGLVWVILTPFDLLCLGLKEEGQKIIGWTKGIIYPF